MLTWTSSESPIQKNLVLMKYLYVLYTRKVLIITYTGTCVGKALFTQLNFDVVFKTWIVSFLHIFHILSLNIHTVWNLTLRSKVINILHSKLMLFVGRWHYLLAYSNRRTLRRLPFEFSGGWFFRCKVIYFQLFRSRFFRAKTSYIFTTPLITAIDLNIYFDSHIYFHLLQG